MTTKIDLTNIADTALTTLTGLKVTTIVYIGDDTATDTAGGATINLTGNGFQSGCSVLVASTASSVVTFISATQISFVAPALSAGTYVIYVINPDGGTAISIPGISYSGTPTWSTAAGTLGNAYETGSISATLTATGDAPITYTLATGTLPTGSTLNSNGTISGTAVATASATTYSFTITANDAQNQTTNRAFSLTINPDVVTWSSPANSTTYEVFKDSAIANVAMSATSASGQNITYTADTLPTGLSITGANIAGTPTVAASTTSTLTATASVTNRLATRTINWVVSIANDTYFKNTTLLLNGETTVTPFISDASTNAFAVTVVGDTKPNYFNPYTPGYYSTYLNGSSYISTPGSATAALNLGTGTCIEGYSYITTVSSYGFIISSVQGTGSFTPWWYVGHDNSGNWRVGPGDATDNNLTSYPMTKNVWNHFALTNNGTATRLFVNGVLIYYKAVTPPNTDLQFALSQYGGNIQYLITGYVSNIRVIKGSANIPAGYLTSSTTLGTTVFTPSTTPLTAVTGTNLLICQSNRHIDTSTNAFALTLGSAPTINSLHPFTPNSSYSTYGSAYLDGTGDTLTIPSPTTGLSFGTGEFTIEMWVYKTSAENDGLLDARSAPAATPWFLGIDASNFPYLYDGTSYTSSVAVTINSWSHVSLVRTSGVLKIFVNGVQGYSASYGTNLDRTAGLVIGDTIHAAAPLLGYISNLRIVKGTAVYTSAFTPPTAPLTAIANTSLLTLQYNGGATNQAIIDNSNFNNIITRVGNTSQGTFSPYSVTGWSLYTNGSSSYAYLPYSSTRSIGTGDFSIECWIYIAKQPANYTRVWSHQSNWGLAGSIGVELGFGTVDTLIQTLVDGNSQVYSSATYDTGNGSGHVRQWIHVVSSRQNGYLRLFVNGILREASASTTNINGTSTTSFGTNSQLGGDLTELYMSNFRMCIGSVPASYSTTSTTSNTTIFTPPTSPVTVTSQGASNVTLLLFQSNRFVDNSPYNFAITTVSSPSIQAFGPFGSVPEATPISYSNYFDGTGDYLTIPASSNFNFGSGDFTIETWFYLAENSSPQGSNSMEAILFSTDDDINSGAVTDGSVALAITGNTTTTGTGIIFYRRQTSGAYAEEFFYGVAITQKTWHHVAVVKSGTNIKIFFNGSSVLSTTAVNTTFGTSAKPFSIGGRFITNYRSYLNGYLSNFRVVKGTAVYTTTFTPSTTPLTAIANTSLLTCQSTTMIDNSTNAFALTANGDAKPRIFNPFGYTAQTYTSYTPSTHGGSAYFDGTGDYLSVPTSSPLVLSGGVWTIECWCYLTSSSFSTYRILINKRSGSSAASYDLYFNITNGYLSFYNGTEYWSTTVPNIGVWNHIAAVYDGTNINLFMNGVRVLQTATTNPDNGGNLYIGADENGTSNFFIGYISDVRIIKGTAVYTSSFLPPTTSVTSTNNTVLLLNFNSGGIIDQHSTNVLETVGNAQLSTSVKKYNNASMYFDGNGDYLVMPNTLTGNFGTGDFTVEYWDYHGTQGTNYSPQVGTLSSASPSGTWRFGTFSNNGGLYFAYHTGSAYVDVTFGSAAYNDSVWRHFAISRQSGTIRAFVNGVQVGTNQTITQNFNSTNRVSIGAELVTPSYFNGYLDDLRITKGYARYTTTFTPPTSALIAK